MHATRVSLTSRSRILWAAVIAVVCACLLSGCGDSERRTDSGHSWGPGYPPVSPNSQSEVRWEYLGEDAVLSWDPLAYHQRTPSHYLWCEHWSAIGDWWVDFGEYAVDWVSGSPEVARAVALTCRFDEFGDPNYQLLLVEEADKGPEVTLIRELTQPADGRFYASATMALDGQTIGLSSYKTVETVTDTTGEDALEVMDISGTTVWKATLPISPPSTFSVRWSRDLTVAVCRGVLVSALSSEDASEFDLQTRFVAVCKQPGVVDTLTPDSLGLMLDEVVTCVTVSADGTLMAVLSQKPEAALTSMSLYRLGANTSLVWKVSGYFDEPLFSATGSLLVTAVDNYDESANETIRTLSVLSTLDGRTVMERTDTRAGEGDPSEYWGGLSMSYFDSYFVWEAFDGTEVTVDLRRKVPRVIEGDQ